MNRARLFLSGVALAAVLAACGSASGGGSTADPADADVTVTSVDMAFQPTTVTAPAGEGFTLALVNEDPMPHNVAIFTDETKAEKLFEGAVVTDGTIVYDVPALAAGEYYFICSLHPEMAGTLVVEG